MVATRDATFITFSTDQQLIVFKSWLIAVPAETLEAIYAGEVDPVACKVR